jgi:hypothetical protein
MSELNERQKNLILDLYFACGNEEDLNDARALVASNSEAAVLYDRLESQMDVLGHVKESPVLCPDHLAQKTIEKLKFVASQTNNIRLTELLAAEQNKSIIHERGFWKRGLDVAAAAAAVLVVAGLYLPTVNNIRYKSWLASCQSNMASIAQGLTSYAGDNQNQLPSVENPKDSPWWKVGYQGEENLSNTRPLWKLVQGKYVRPGVFVCPGRSAGRAVSLDNQRIGHLKDFPERKYITYSSILTGNDSAPVITQTRIIFISDSNPIFEGVNADTRSKDSREFKAVELCEKLRHKNSLNHNRRGQNIMLTDGNVQFIKTRQIQLGDNDDIFTVKGRNTYSGRERPTGDNDVFLVP